MDDCFLELVNLVECDNVEKKIVVVRIVVAIRIRVPNFELKILLIGVGAGSEKKIDRIQFFKRAANYNWKI